MTAVLVIAAFGMLTVFTGRPDRRTAVWVWAAAATVVVAELLLSGGLDTPERLIPLVLAATGAPAYALLSRDEHRAAARGMLRAVAPWMYAAAATLAALEFGRAWLAAAGEQRTTLLHTGVQLAGVAMSWFVISHSRRRPALVALRTAAAVLAMLIVAGMSHAAVLGNFADAAQGTQHPSPK